MKWPWFKVESVTKTCLTLGRASVRDRRGELRGQRWWWSWCTRPPLAETPVAHFAFMDAQRGGEMAAAAHTGVAMSPLSNESSRIYSNHKLDCVLWVAKGDNLFIRNALIKFTKIGSKLGWAYNTQTLSVGKSSHQEVISFFCRFWLIMWI